MTVLKLIIEDDEGRKTVVPFVRDEITIGRQEGNTIRLTERNVSRRHARLMRQNGHVLIEDLGSYNGIRVNGDRIKGQVSLGDGDLVQIGDYDLALQAERSEAATVNMALVDATVPLTAAPQRGSGPQRRPDLAATVTGVPVTSPVPSAADDDVQEVPSAETEPPKHQSTAVIRMDQVQGAKPPRANTSLEPAQAPRLVVLNTDFAGQEFSCTKTELKIGRTDDNDIALDHRSLSRTHCKVVREDNGEWRVIDMQSANGLIVNGEPYAQVTLRSGDVIELGHVKLKFVGPGVTYSPGKNAGSHVTMETDEPVRQPRSALVPVIVAVLLAAVGLGAYLVWNQPFGSVTTPKPPPGTAVENRPDDDGSAKSVAATKVAEAKKAILELDFIRAEGLLRQAKVNDAQLPEAASMLTKLQSEGGFKRALEQAKAALAKGELQEARRQLDASRDTDLLKPTWHSLEASLSEATKAALKPSTPVSNVGDEEVPEVQQAIASAKDLLVKGEYRRTISLLSGTAKKYPGCHECKALIGSAFCRDDDQAQCVRWYTRFLAEAPQTHPRYGQVKQLLQKFQADKRKQGE